MLLWWGSTQARLGLTDGVARLNEGLEIARGVDEPLEELIKDRIESGGKSWCRHGRECYHNQKGKCMFYHPATETSLTEGVKLGL